MKLGRDDLGHILRLLSGRNFLKCSVHEIVNSEHPMGKMYGKTLKGEMVKTLKGLEGKGGCCATRVVERSRFGVGRTELRCCAEEL